MSDKGLYVLPVKIALFGPAGSGKDYVTKKIIEYFRFSSDQEDSPKMQVDFKRFAFADKLKKIANIIIGRSDMESADLAIYSEEFKNHYFIDLETLECRWIMDLPKESHTVIQGMFGRRVHRVFHDDRIADDDLRHYVIYTADDLLDLCDKGKSATVGSYMTPNMIIPNISSFWQYETVEYPAGYNKDNCQHRRLISYREFIVWLGTFCFQPLLGKNSLVNMMFNDAEYRDTVVRPWHGVIVTDMRFPHEYEACKARGFKIVKIVPEEKDIEINNIAESYYSTFESDFDFFNSRNEGHFNQEMKRFKKFLCDSFAEPFDESKHYEIE